MKVNGGKTIASVIIKYIFSLNIVVVFLFVLFTSVFEFFTTYRIMTASLSVEANAAAKRISLIVESYKNIVKGIGTIPELSRDDVSVDYKKKILDNRISEYKLVRSRVIKADGYSDMDQMFRGDRDYFKEAMGGKTVISDPLVSRAGSDVSIVVAAPVWKEGIYNSTVDSVVFCGLDPSVLNGIMERFILSKNSDAYIIDRTGTTVAAKREILFYKMNNNISIAKYNKKYRKIAEMEKKILDGEHGIHFFRKGLAFHCYASAPIENTPGWTVILGSPMSDHFMSLILPSLVLTVLVTLTLILSRMYMKKIARRISLPVEKMAERLKRAGSGDISSEIDFDDSIKEISIISDATQKLLDRMQLVLNGNQIVRSNFRLENTINFGFMADVEKCLQRGMDGGIRIYDIFSNLLYGDPFYAGTASAFSDIVINSRSMGRLELIAGESFKGSEENLKCFAESLSVLLGKTAEESLIRKSRYKLWCENEELNVRNIVAGTEKLSILMKIWLEDIRNEKMTDQKDFFRNFERQAVSVLSVIQENAEYAHFTDYNYISDERDYEVQALFIEVKSAIQNDSEVRFPCRFTTSSSLPLKLFGDDVGIKKVVSRLAVLCGTKKGDAPVSIEFDCEKNTYNVVLEIAISMEQNPFSSDELERLKILTKKSDHVIERLSSYERKFYSAFKLGYMINSRFEIDDSNGKFVMKVFVPQLSVD